LGYRGGASLPKPAGKKHAPILDRDRLLPILDPAIS
jgi:hypothetical protein